MKRRSFLAMLGLAPVAGAAAAAQPQAVEIDWKGIESATVGDFHSGMFIDTAADSGSTRVVLRADQFRISGI